MPPKDRDIAMVFQSYALFPHMTVFDNIAFGMKIRRLAKSEIDTQVHSVADRLRIGSLLDRLPKALWGASVAGSRSLAHWSAQNLPHGRATVKSRREASHRGA